MSLAGRAGGPQQCDGGPAAAVSAAVRAHPGLRRVRAQLLADIGALLAGLRPAVMLDYAVAPVEVVASLVHCLSMTAAPEGAPRCAFVVLAAC